MGERLSKGEEVGAHESVRAATAAAHQTLENALGLLSPKLTCRDYVSYLRCMEAFHGPLERRLAHSARFCAALDDFDDRTRTHLIALDLAALGEAGPTQMATPILPTTENLASLFGVAYVFEGSTLGGQILRRELARRLELSPDCLRYVSGYQRETADRWRYFLKCFELACHSSEAREHANASALATFSLLADWALATR